MTLESNYRVCWAQGRGYFAQFRDGEGWTDLHPGRGSGHVDARLDCELAAARAGEPCRLDERIANLTPGRPEYKDEEVE